MSDNLCPDIGVYICQNCIPVKGDIPRQWNQDGVHVSVKEVPCSGKIDIQYMFHAFEGGARGLCLVACPEGKCRRAEGNYRAEIRVHTVKRLLGEIGFEPERAELLHFSAEAGIEKLDTIIREAVKRLVELGENPIKLNKEENK